MNQQQFNRLLDNEIEQMCQLAIAEDIAGEQNLDITAELIQANKNARATLITRESGVLCGTAWVEKIFRLLSDQVKINWNFKDGDQITANDVICHISGNARVLLTGERSAMNFLQTLSATASQTARYVSELKNPQCQLLDTRKTIPGMRFGQKYAVKCGGGTNHRIGLSDAFLIKENHIIACEGILNALNKARENHPDKLLEIEVESIDELSLALQGKPDVIMLDNFETEQLFQAVDIRNKLSNETKLEASGNVSLSTLGDISQTGVDYISVGSLTKNVQALDLSMRISIA